MGTILCYGDSNTHGTMPMRLAGLSERLPLADRWPGVAAAALGTAHELIAEGLPGRTTVHDDPVEGGCRNGLAVLPAILHSHKPLDLVVLMLGTNDLKPRFSVTAWDIARSVERLVACVRAEQVARDVMVVCPAPVRETGTLADVFAGAETRQQGLEPLMRAMAARLGCAYVAAQDHVSVSARDGVHWDAPAHADFGAVMAREILLTLERGA